jgi:hypothetical protein
MLKIAKKNNNPSIDNVITRVCNVVFAILPSNRRGYGGSTLQKSGYDRAFL